MPATPRPKRAVRPPPAHDWDAAAASRARHPPPPPAVLAALDRVLDDYGSTPMPGRGGCAVAGPVAPAQPASHAAATPRGRRRRGGGGGGPPADHAATAQLAVANAQAESLAAALASARAEADGWRAHSASLASALEVTVPVLSPFAGGGGNGIMLDADDPLQAAIVASPPRATGAAPPSPASGVDEFDLAACMLGRLPSYKSWE